MAENDDFEVVERQLKVTSPHQGALPAAPAVEEAAGVAPRALPPTAAVGGGDDAPPTPVSSVSSEGGAAEVMRNLEAQNEKWLKEERQDRQKQARQEPAWQEPARVQGGGGGGRGVGGGRGGGRFISKNNNGGGQNFFGSALSKFSHVFACSVLALAISAVQPPFARWVFFGSVACFALRKATLDRGRGAGGGRGAARPGGRGITKLDVVKGLFVLTTAGILLGQAHDEKREKDKRKPEKSKRKRSPRKNASRASSSLGALPSCTASGTSISCSIEF